jgi:hypothetical protein
MSNEARYQAAVRFVDISITNGAERNKLKFLEERWLRATSDDERARIADDAETLATAVGKSRCHCYGAPIEFEPAHRDSALIDVQTPGSIKAEMDTTRAIIHQLDADVAASSVDASFKTAWRTFVDEFDAFYKQHQGWLERFWYSTYAKTVEFRQRAIDWRARFVALGGTPSAPEDRAPERPDLVATVTRTALWAAGIYGGLKLVELFRPAARAVRNRRGQVVTRRALYRELERVAERPRNASKWPDAMCPVCHRYKFTDAKGRLVKHEYPSGGMCSGGGGWPLSSDEDAR